METGGLGELALSSPDAQRNAKTLNPITLKPLCDTIACYKHAQSQTPQSSRTDVRDPDRSAKKTPSSFANHEEKHTQPQKRHVIPELATESSPWRYKSPSPSANLLPLVYNTVIPTAGRNPAHSTNQRLITIRQPRTFSIQTQRDSSSRFGDRQRAG